MASEIEAHGVLLLFLTPLTSFAGSPWAACLQLCFPRYAIFSNHYRNDAGALFGGESQAFFYSCTPFSRICAHAHAHAHTHLTFFLEF